MDLLDAQTETRETAADQAAEAASYVEALLCKIASAGVPTLGLPPTQEGKRAAPEGVAGSGATKAESGMAAIGAQLAGEVKSAGAALSSLLRAKAESDRKNYAAKHQILKEMFHHNPDDFAADGDVRPGGYAGYTHKKTGFRFHVPMGLFQTSEKAAADETRPPVVAVDLDGTLAKMYDKFDKSKIEPPRKGARKAMEDLKELGCEILIHTCRGDTKLIKEWLAEHKIPYDHIGKAPSQPKDSSTKPMADIYVDDRALDARGPWSGLKEEIKERLGLERLLAKEAGVFDGMIAGLGRAAGATGRLFGGAGRVVGHTANYGTQPFRFRGLPAAVPEGPYFAERQQALNNGQGFLQNLQNLSGFSPYAARIKDPTSMAAHGTGVTNDLLGLRLRAGAGGGYTPEHVQNLLGQLSEAGMDAQSHRLLTRPGYHGWNIKGTVNGSPTEIQLSPRRLQPLSALDHDAIYKPDVLGLPSYMQTGLQRTLPTAMNLMSPMSGPGWQRARQAIGYGAMGTGIAGAGLLSTRFGTPAGNPAPLSPPAFPAQNPDVLPAPEAAALPAVVAAPAETTSLPPPEFSGQYPVMKQGAVSLLKEAADLYLWQQVPADVSRLMKTAATIQQNLRRVASKLKAQDPGYGNVFYHPKTKEVWAVLSDSDTEQSHQRWHNALKSIPGVQHVRTESEAYPPNRDEWLWIKRADSILQAPYTAAGTLTGGPTPLTNGIVNTLIGGAAGYGLGHLAENLLPEEYFERGKLSRTGMMLGMVPGIADAGMQAYTRAGIPDAAGNNPGWRALVTPDDQVTVHPSAFEHMNNLHAGSGRPKFAAVLEILGKVTEGWPVSPAFRKAAESETGIGNLTSVPVDAFNRAIWNDVSPGAARSNPYGTKDPWGDNNQNLGTPPASAAAVSGLITGVSDMYGGSSILSPRHFINGLAAAGIDRSTATVAGSVLGFLGGLKPDAQRQLQEAGMWSGLIRGVASSVLGL